MRNTLTVALLSAASLCAFACVTPAAAQTFAPGYGYGYAPGYGYGYGAGAWPYGPTGTFAGSYPVTGASTYSVGGALGSVAGPQLPPAPSVTYNGPVSVGAKIPRDGSVPTYFIPNYSHRYAYTVLNGQEVVVNRRTARIVRVVP